MTAILQTAPSASIILQRPATVSLPLPISAAISAAVFGPSPRMATMRARLERRERKPASCSFPAFCGRSASRTGSVASEAPESLHGAGIAAESNVSLPSFPVFGP